MARRLLRGQAQAIIEMYTVQKMNCPQIARQIGAASSSVHALLSRSGVPMRSRSEAKSLCVRRGSDSPCWKGGVRKDGYKVRSANANGRRRNILQHREIASKALGRQLTRGEVVHHCNGDTSDNSLQNLWVFPSQAAHAKYHKSGEVHPDTVFLGR